MSDVEARAFKKVRNPATGRSGLVPADQFADEFMASLKDGQQVLVTVRKPRSIAQHRWLFALLRKVVENSDKWADEKVLLDDLKLATGLFETRVSAINGLPYPVPASISFAAMDGARFSTWVDKAVSVLARDVLGCAPEALRAEVEAMLDPSERRAAA